MTKQPDYKNILQTEWVDIKKCINYKENPRLITPERLESLKKSITDDPGYMLQYPPYGYQDPKTEEYVVMGGNQRLEVCRQLGWKKFPIIIDPNLVLKDGTLNTVLIKNRVAKGNITWGEFDSSKLSEYYTQEDLQPFEGLDVDIDSVIDGSFSDDFDFSNEDTNKDELRNDFSQNIGKVVYEPKETNHQPKDLYTPPDQDLYNLIDSIENTDLKKILNLRAALFTKINFEKMADYYAYQATENEQKVFEKLGLVILDRDQMIENGYADLVDELSQINTEQ